MQMHEARFWEPLGDGKVHCELCPHGCIIGPGRSGFCRARKNLDGKLYAATYARPVSVNADPVEKKPLYHFLPGSLSLSLGTAGCNLDCLHCQNFEISRADPDRIESIGLPPESVVGLARKQGCDSVSYTYTEPTVFFEYAMDCAVLARKSGLKNVLVTSGFISPGPAAEFAGVMDAANVDIKAFAEEFYRDVCKGSLGPVLEAIKVYKKAGMWIELTNLIINKKNDRLEDIERMCAWIRDNLGKGTPLHFSRAMPMHRMADVGPTSLSTLQKARATALKYLDYVYIGNVQAEEAGNTYCPGCKALLIERDFYLVEKMFDRSCSRCNRVIEGVYAKD